MTTAANDRLRVLYEELAASRRDTPPPADEADQWTVVIDQDTGKPCWFPKALDEAWQTARWPHSKIDP